jgi:hypothetical protein
MSVETIEPTPLAEPLDRFLVEIVKTLSTAADQGIKGLEENPASVDGRLADCKEILDLIMAGQVEEWIG